MQTGLHAIRWGLLRAGVALGILLCATAFAYVIWVVVIVVSQAAAEWGS